MLNIPRPSITTTGLGWHQFLDFEVGQQFAGFDFFGGFCRPHYLHYYIIGIPVWLLKSTGYLLASSSGDVKTSEKVTAMAFLRLF